MRQLRLYTRRGCHLCEDMQAELESLMEQQGFVLELIDVDRESGLQDRYGSRVPVLESPEGQTLCEYFLDREVLLSYLDGG